MPDMQDRRTVLQTARLTLRPLSIADLTEFLRTLEHSRDHLAPYCPLHAPGSGGEDDHETFVRQLELSRGAISTGRALRLNAFTNDGSLVGGFNLNDIQHGLEHVAELVLWVGVDHAGQGYASEGVARVLDHAFNDPPRGLGLHRVMALVSPDNSPCLHVLHKAGFRANPNAGQVELTIGSRRIAHNVFDVFAPISIESGVQVEGKPSLPRQVRGTGLLSILKTEASHKNH